MEFGKGQRTSEEFADGKDSRPDCLTWDTYQALNTKDLAVTEKLQQSQSQAFDHL